MNTESRSNLSQRHHHKYTTTLVVRKRVLDKLRLFILFYYMAIHHSSRGFEFFHYLTAVFCIRIIVITSLLLSQSKAGWYNAVSSGHRRRPC